MSSEALRIALDLDGVLAESMVVWCRKCTETFAKPIRLEDLTSWHSWKRVGINEEDFYRLLDEAWISWEEIPPTEPELAAKVDTISRYGVLDLVTGRSPQTVPYAKKWLQKYGIRVNSFVRVKSVSAKAKLSYDIFIDDSPSLMLDIASRLDGYGILYARPWNQDFKNVKRIMKVTSLSEVPQRLEEISSVT